MLANAEQRLKRRCVKKIENIERKLEQVPFIQTKSEDFNEASRERKDYAKYLNEERRTCEDNLVTVRGILR